ncbi:hypothetical protein BH09DEP1_BH09DEP1_6610 [soil metagenome]
MFTIKKSYLLPLLSFCVSAEGMPIARIVNHIHLISGLKEHFAKKVEVPVRKRATKTPTLSYLKAVEDGKIVHNGWGPNPINTIKQYRSDYKQIVDLAIDRELQYCNDYYVFYHGLSNSFNVFQDFLKEFNAFLNVSGKKLDFEFLRMWQDAEKQIDANKWLASRPGYIINTLIFVNLSLFGNLQNGSSHSFGYFKDNISGGIHLTDSLLRKLFTHYGLDSKYVSDLITLNQKYLTPEGGLIQFFIPRDKVDQYVYLGGGSATTYGTPLVPSVWDAGLGRHTKIATILDKYIDDIGSIKNFDYLQACILSSQDFLLDPNQDIKMFKYVTIKDKDREQYQKELKQICNKMFSEWIKTQSYINTESTVLGRLMSLMSK